MTRRLHFIGKCLELCRLGLKYNAMHSDSLDTRFKATNHAQIGEMCELGNLSPGSNASLIGVWVRKENARGAGVWDFW